MHTDHFLYVIIKYSHIVWMWDVMDNDDDDVDDNDVFCFIFFFFSLCWDFLSFFHLTYLKDKIR